MRDETRKAVRQDPTPPASMMTARRCTVAAPGDYAADDLRAVRAKLGLSQTVFAEVLGVSKSLVEHWERGVRSPSTTIRRLLDAVSGSPEFLTLTVKAGRAE